jgi:hypothetical protein
MATSVALEEAPDCVVPTRPRSQQYAPAERQAVAFRQKGDLRTSNADCVMYMSEPASEHERACERT